MAKRTRVPAALHSELSEYSSLLRALRTTHTLDLSSQLSQVVTPPVPATSEVELSNDEDEKQEYHVDHKATSPPQTSDAAIEELERPRPKPKRAGPTNDVWTRWPLLAGDVHVPEWGLDEEIRLIASQSMKDSKTSSGRSSEDDGTVNVEDEDDLLPDSSLIALRNDSVNHLSHMLSTLSFCIPLVEKSLRNRVRPLNWERVLAAVSASGTISDEFVSPIFPLSCIA